MSSARTIPIFARTKQFGPCEDRETLPANKIKRICLTLDNWSSDKKQHPMVKARIPIPTCNHVCLFPLHVSQRRTLALATSRRCSLADLKELNGLLTLALIQSIKTISTKQSSESTKTAYQVRECDFTYSSLSSTLTHWA